MSWAYLALLAALALGVKIRLLRRPNLFFCDGIEYLSIARAMATGQGYVLPIKAYFETRTPVLHSPLRDVGRTPLYPALIAALWRVCPSVVAVQLLGALMSLAAGVVMAWSVRRWAGPEAGCWAGVLTVLIPDLFSLSCLAFVEPLVALLAALLAASTLALGEAGQPSAGVAAGFSLAALIWARPNAAALLFAWLAWTLTAARSNPGAWIAAAMGAGGWFAYLRFAAGQVRPGDVQAVLAAHLRDHHGRKMVWRGHQWDPADAINEVRKHPAGALRAVAATLLRGVLRLASPKLLFVPGLAGIACWAHFGARQPESLGLVFLAAANTLASSLFPASGTPTRYHVASLVLLLPVACQGLGLLGSMEHQRALFVLWVGGYALYDVRRLFRGIERDKQGYSARYAQTAQWLKAHVKEDEVIAASDPWIVHWQTGRPALLLTFFEELVPMRGFLRSHEARWIVFDEGFLSYSWCSAWDLWPGAGVRRLVDGGAPWASLRATFEADGGKIRVYEVAQEMRGERHGHY